MGFSKGFEIVSIALCWLIYPEKGEEGQDNLAWPAAAYYLYSFLAICCSRSWWLTGRVWLAEGLSKTSP